MFNRIAPGYDRFNALASFGLHKNWREVMVRAIPSGAKVLDIATGTGDVAFSARKHGHEVVGLDFSEEMIRRAQAKDRQQSIRWVVGSAAALPFASEEFGAVTSAFALRNMRSCLDDVFRESFRVLKSGGLAQHLDFGRPGFPMMRWGHQVHTRVGVPLIGRLLLGQRWPQGYLADTIRDFYNPSQVEDRLEAAGFINVSHQSLMGGVVQLYRGTKA